MPAGNNPQPTIPVLASSEHLATRLLGDYAQIHPEWTSLAEGADGAFAAGSPWVLTSASVDFQAQGVSPQDVVVLRVSAVAPASRLFAVDSVAGNDCTLRKIGMAPGIGQPPAPQAGGTGYSFSIPTAYLILERASYEIKRYLRIDEAIFWRNSQWIYQGAEDRYRVLRDFVVEQAVVYLFDALARNGGEADDWMRKLRDARKNLEYIKAQIEIRWGPFGTSAQPTSSLGCKMSR